MFKEHETGLLIRVSQNGDTAHRWSVKLKEVEGADLAGQISCRVGKKLATARIDNVWFCNEEGGIDDSAESTDQMIPHSWGGQNSGSIKGKHVLRGLCLPVIWHKDTSMNEDKNPHYGTNFCSFPIEFRGSFRGIMEIICSIDAGIWSTKK